MSVSALLFSATLLVPAPPAHPATVQQQTDAQEQGEVQRSYPVPKDLHALMQDSMLADFTDWLQARAEGQGLRPPQVRHGGRALDQGGVGKVLLWADPKKEPVLVSMELPRRLEPSPEAPAQQPPQVHLDVMHEQISGFVRRDESGEVIFQTDDAQLRLDELDQLRVDTLIRADRSTWGIRCDWSTPVGSVAAVMDALYAGGQGFEKIAHNGRFLDDRDRKNLACIAPELEPQKIPRIEGEVLLVLGPELPYADLQFLMQAFAERRFSALSLAVIGPDQAWGKIPLWIPSEDDLELIEEEEMEDIDDEGDGFR